MKGHGLLEKKNDQGCIMYADDQFINRQYLQHTFTLEIKLMDRF